MKNNIIRFCATRNFFLHDTSEKNLDANKKGGVRMCPPIDKIYKKSALEILEEFGTSNKIPIDLNALLKNIGISALPMDFSSLEKKLDKGHILGLVLSSEDNAVIYYSQNDTPNRQRFTIAHELGHICEHLRPDSNDYPYIDWRIEEEATSVEEIKANIFAGELLIPLHKLKEVYLSMSIPSSANLAALFGTSVNVMEKRLDYLCVSYYNKDGQAVVKQYGS
ncbi:MAG: ImmA/IrrE family metallo-endopeptidase [Lachnospiraceae bacterium]|nr:ImmA/IrrE family metallo-endopeptidase [Lachnospiraceae bacterium]